MVLLLQPKAMTIYKKLPSQEDLCKLFEYREGNLYWKLKPAQNVKIGDKAGSFHHTGYLTLRINNVRYQMHRITWAYHYGAIPSNLQIDHIDGNKANNMIENLRLATNSQNQGNIKHAQRNSKSNILGVFWKKARNKWHAQIQINSKFIHLGYFVNQEDAIAARKAAELQYFGEFAR